MPTREAARPCWLQGARLGLGFGRGIHGTFSLVFRGFGEGIALVRRVARIVFDGCLRQIPGNKKAPLRVLCSGVASRGRYIDAAAKITGGRRTRPALTRWACSDISSGNCFMGAVRLRFWVCIE
ncbi:hypothetical protein AZ78_4632 [Lysobacter capsici AZ78]|uniref:Uncharacterized protein n=1 Tax=Lysobacter capsici AZ78 TaxID=1444315 RepID=A0A125MNM6_9GAMM|nr:hypothetical protein AZ78_4632 [Lysobacter capsici AZ78]